MTMNLHATDGKVPTASISEREKREIEVANASDKLPVVARQPHGTT
jgi:hypothetical protein